MDLDFDALDEQEEEARLALAREAGFAPEREAMKIRRLWCISDVHTDSVENMAWLERLHESEFKKDVLILAGDVSHDLQVLEKTFMICKERFADVLFTPGNHDVWLLNDPAYKKGECTYKNSLEKVRHILELCDGMGIRVRPQLYEMGEEALWVAPILSYHHVSFDTEPDLQAYWEGIQPYDKALSDFRFTVWPDMEMGSDAVADCLDALNEDLLEGMPTEDLEAYRAVALAAPESRSDACTKLVTFSHFLPRLELMPEKRFMTYPDLAKAAGSKALERRIGAMKPDVHVFGHTHFGWDIEIEGTRFIQAALAMPKERNSRITSYIGDEFARPSISQPLLLCDEDEWAPHYQASFSEYYSKYSRKPEEFRIVHQPVRKAYKWIGPGEPPTDEETPFEHGNHLMNFAPRWSLFHLQRAIGADLGEVTGADLSNVPELAKSAD